ncbi:MAG: TetR family transcriptional regulator [Succinivibrionaceae bacterium]
MVRKTREEAQKTKESIMDIALDIFCEKGYEKTNLSDIAKRANVTRGAIYWHFENKDELFIEIWKKLINKSDNIFLSNNISFTEDDSPLELLRLSIFNASSFLSSNDNIAFLKIILSIQYGKQGSKRIKNMVNNIHNDFKNRYKKLLQKAAEKHEIDEFSNIDFLLNYIKAILDGYLLSYIIGENNDIINKVELIANMLIHNLKNMHNYQKIQLN